MDTNTSMEVPETANCHNVQGILNYINFVYCDFDGHFLPIAVIICIAWLIILFLFLGTTTDQFFCPSLDCICKTLRLSQNVAGVTFLAFGNGAPDIFASIAGARQARPQMVIGALFGAGIFVTCIVAGTIIITTNFEIMKRPFLRDVIFYLIAVYWAFILFYKGSIDVINSLGFIILYIIYMSVVLIGHHIYQKYKNSRKELSSIQVEQPVISTTASPIGFNVRPFTDPDVNGDEEIVPWGGPLIIKKKSLSEGSPHHSKDQENQNTNATINSVECEDFTKNESTPLLSSELNANSIKASVKLFLLALTPINLKEWQKIRWWQKTLHLVKAPNVFMLKLIVPLVDFSEDLNGWCRPLNAFHCIVSPVFIVFAFGCGDSYVDHLIPVWCIVLFGGIVASLILLMTTTNTETPRFHCIFGFFGFATSVICIYVIATEIVSLLKTIGVVMNLSDTILGLTLLAWGNSISDLIADVSIAKQGSAKMALSACYGGPLFNLLFGIGIPFTMVAVQEGAAVKVFFNEPVAILSGFLFASLSISLVVITFLGFKSSRPLGIFLIVFYFVFLTVSILNELRLI